MVYTNYVVLVRPAGFEPATSSMSTRCATTAPRPQDVPERALNRRAKAAGHPRGRRHKGCRRSLVPGSGPRNARHEGRRAPSGHGPGRILVRAKGLEPPCHKAPEPNPVRLPISPRPHTCILADGVGFEPTEPLRALRISNPALSAALPPIQEVAALNL